MFRLALILPGAFLTILTVFSVTGCKTEEGSKVLTESRPKPTPVKKPDVLVVAPERADQFQLSLEELMKVTRAIQKIQERPTASVSEGCVSFHPINAGPIFLKIDFQCSRQIQSFITSKPEPKFRLAHQGTMRFMISSSAQVGEVLLGEGELELTVVPSDSSPDSSIDVSTTSAIRTQKATIVRSNVDDVHNTLYRTTWEFSHRPAPEMNSPKSLSDSSFAALADKPEGPEWNAKLFGTWHVGVNNFSWLERGAWIIFNLTQSTGKTTAKPIKSKLELTAETDVQFLEGSCRRPLGRFSWVLKQEGASPSSGSFVADASGVTAEEPNAKRVDWPAHCLEND